MFFFTGNGNNQDIQVFNLSWKHPKKLQFILHDPNSQISCTSQVCGKQLKKKKQDFL